jgi:hypothetical protein
MRIQGLAFRSSSQESRFRVFFALKRWPLDVASAVFPLTFLWLIQSWRYFTMRGCSCSLEVPEPCEQFRSQAAWLASFPCTPLDGTSAASLLVLGRWYLANWYHVHVGFLWKHEFVDIGFILALHACVAVLALAGKQFWSVGQGRRNVLVALRVAQKAQNLIAVFTVRPAHTPSFMDVHFGPSTVYGATVLAWYTVITAVRLVRHIFPARLQHLTGVQFAGHLDRQCLAGAAGMGIPGGDHRRAQQCAAVALVRVRGAGQAAAHRHAAAGGAAVRY